MWSQALAGVQKHLITSTKYSNLKFVAELPSGIGGRLSPKMDHIVCFLPGSIALGATGGITVAEARRAPGWDAEKDEQMRLATELMKTCWGMYEVTETGLAPEIAWFHADDATLQPTARASPLSPSENSEAAWKADYIIKPQDAHNLQRPETVESLFMMWRITNDPIYREWGWKIFKAFQNHTILDDGEGHSSLDNVNMSPPPRRDNMESFWLVRETSYDSQLNDVLETDLTALPGRDTEISVSSIFAHRLPPPLRCCLQHGSAHFPSNQAGEVSDRVAAQA